MTRKRKQVKYHARPNVGRRLQIVAGVMLTAAVGAVFYYSFNVRKAPSVALTPPNTNTAADMRSRNPLTGERMNEVKDFFAVSVMYDNFGDVKVRPGLEDASIVYEALAEGGITRFMAVFESTKQVVKFGPIRSIRPYFIDWASEYGGAVMHVGGSPEALEKIKKSPLKDINQMGADEHYFTRDESLEAPHNVFSTFSSWLTIGERLKIEPQQITPWKFADTVEQTGRAERQQFEIMFWPDNHVGWAYYRQNNTYVRFLNNERQIGANGNQIAASNVILIEVPSTTIDTIGRQKMKTTSSGTAVIFTNGRRITGRWMKDSATARMRFLTDEQDEVTLTPGITWIEVVPSFDIVDEQKN